MLKNNFENKNFAIFEELVDNFGRTDNDIVKKCLFLVEACVVSCPACTKNLERYLVSAS